MTRHDTVGEKVHLSFRFEDAEDLNEDEESRKVNDSDQTRKNLMKINRMKAVMKTIPIVGGILDSLSWITDPKAQDSGFHNKRFPGILI